MKKLITFLTGINIISLNNNYINNNLLNSKNEGIVIDIRNLKASTTVNGKSDTIIQQNFDGMAGDSPIKIINPYNKENSLIIWQKCFYKLFPTIPFMGLTGIFSISLPKKDYFEQILPITLDNMTKISDLSYSFNYSMSLHSEVGFSSNAGILSTTIELDFNSAKNSFNILISGFAKDISSVHSPGGDICENTIDGIGIIHP